VILVITKHTKIPDYLLEMGLIQEGEFVRKIHALPREIKGRHVICTHTISLTHMVLAKSITMIPLAFTVEDRLEPHLEIQRIREIAGEPVSYRVVSCAESAGLRNKEPLPI
jgi:hypothetical protein